VKYLLIILLLVAFAGVLLYVRLRPYLHAARQIWRLLRAPAAGRDAPLPPRKANASGALTRCAACGVWTPAARALKLGASRYCSHGCLEKASVRRG
jgi:hypothetical protein